MQPDGGNFVKQVLIFVTVFFLAAGVFPVSAAAADTDKLTFGVSTDVSGAFISEGSRNT